MVNAVHRKHDHVELRPRVVPASALQTFSVPDTGGSKPSSEAAAAPAQAAPSGSVAVCSDLHRFIGRSTGSGQCVALVQAASPGVGPTRTWECGEKVQGNTSLQPGTVIATFNRAQKYANAMDGSSHAAIYLGQNSRGVQVLDQWSGRSAAVRTIPWDNPSGKAANTGSAFHVVRTG